MITGPVDWATLRPPETGGSGYEGLREFKKRSMRQLLSARAIEMFLDRGFDEVRVADIADACGVSEKTVYNYFPTKESLLPGRWDTTMVSLQRDLAAADVRPVRAALRILAEELHGQTSWLTGQPDPVAAAAELRRFGTMISDAPSMRARERDMTERLIAAAAAILARRAGMAADDPEPQIAATALIGLWRVQSTSLRRHLEDTAPRRIRAAVTHDVQRAARLIDTELFSFAQPGSPQPGGGSS